MLNVSVSHTDTFKGNFALFGDLFEGWFAKLQPCIINQ